jgi:hypothetical protein
VSIRAFKGSNNMCSSESPLINPIPYQGGKCSFAISARRVLVIHVVVLDSRNQITYLERDLIGKTQSMEMSSSVRYVPIVAQIQALKLVHLNPSEMVSPELASVTERSVLFAAEGLDIY